MFELFDRMSSVPIGVETSFVYLVLSPRKRLNEVPEILKNFCNEAGKVHFFELNWKLTYEIDLHTFGVVRGDVILLKIDLELNPEKFQEKVELTSNFLKQLKAISRQKQIHFIVVSEMKHDSSIEGLLVNWENEYFDNLFYLF